MTTLSDDPNQLDLNLPGLGPDTIFAGAGADLIRTSTLGGSLIFGQADNDTLTSVGPNDTIYGGDDEDSIRSQRTPVLLLGDGGNDTIVAEARATLYGGAGEDFMQGTVEANLMLGNEDADTMLGGAQRRDSLYGGKGNDAIGFFIAGGGNNLSLPGGLAIGFAGNEGSNYLRGDLGDDLVVGINVRDSLFGGRGKDTLKGVASSSYLSGDLDDDILVITNSTQSSPFSSSVITIGIERTTLIGGGGNDSLYGAIGDFGSGRNFFDGGDGNDTINVFATQDTALGGGGDDFIVSATVSALSSVGASSSFPGFAGRNLLDGGSGNDTIVAAFSTDTMIGGEGNDSMSGIFTQASGGDGNDTLNASFAGTNAGLITLDGGLGNDVLIGNSTVGVINFMNGGEGSDSILFGGTRDRLIGTLGGNDTISYATGVNFIGAQSTPNVITDNLGSNFIIGGNGTDVITTGAGDDILFGGPTSLPVAGVDGNDTLNAGGGNDTMLGGFGDDMLFGGDGNDSLGGGPGADTLIGGNGNDSFYYANFGEGVTLGTPLGTNPDQIGDFVVGQDKIVLNSSAFGFGTVNGPSRPGSSQFLVLDNGSYNGQGGLNGQSPLLIYENRLGADDNTGRLLFDPDGSGSQAAVTLANLNGRPGLTVTDIVLI
ncbi:calcium-binding protein [Microcoleus sp. LEGE 07076]|uniref:calcium-binding protein n=1 Tax=Microcoleus sp. LEGE 07076 TaxID=915322 RepID=UPI001881071D|nr:calcium-binding protein [Microcoleus sp. LEGE 07076]MBE9186634.1 calcium-binding protein [Microcoleus sp. LEGE 07076]